MPLELFVKDKLVMDMSPIGLSELSRTFCEGDASRCCLTLLLCVQKHCSHHWLVPKDIHDNFRSYVSDQNDKNPPFSIIVFHTASLFTALSWCTGCHEVSRLH